MFTLVIGKIINQKGLEILFLKMVNILKDNLKMERLKEKEDLFLKQVIILKAIFIKIKLKVKVNLLEL
jgi:hypothetical protein